MMKKDYRPEYSLSIKILATFMGKRELKQLIDKYVIAKTANWGKYDKTKKFN